LIIASASNGAHHVTPLGGMSLTAGRTAAERASRGSGRSTPVAVILHGGPRVRRARPRSGSDARGRDRHRRERSPSRPWSS